MKASILALGALTALTGCATMADGGRLSGEWRAVNINGVAVMDPNAPTLRLEGDRASGKGGCNSYTARVERLSRERVRFSAIASTRMACPEPTMDQERRFLSILEAAEGYSFYSDRSLSLVAGDGRAIRFRRTD